MNTPLTDDLKKYLVPAFERKAVSITALDVSQLTSYADILIIIEALSSRQVTAIAGHMVKKLKAQKIESLGAEGVKSGDWALLDYGHVVIHIFDSETKALYDLEGFWSDAPRIDLSQLAPPESREDDDDF